MKESLRRVVAITGTGAALAFPVLAVTGCDPLTQGRPGAADAQPGADFKAPQDTYLIEAGPNSTLLKVDPFFSKTLDAQGQKAGSLTEYVRQNIPDLYRQQGSESYKGLADLVTDFTQSLNGDNQFGSQNYQVLQKGTLYYLLELYTNQGTYQSTVAEFPGYKPTGKDMTAQQKQHLRKDTIENTTYYFKRLKEVLSNPKSYLSQSNGTIIVTDKTSPLFGDILPTRAIDQTEIGQGLPYAQAAGAVDRSRLPNPTNTPSIAAARAQVKKAARIF